MLKLTCAGRPWVRDLLRLSSREGLQLRPAVFGGPSLHAGGRGPHHADGGGTAAAAPPPSGGAVRPQTAAGSSARFLTNAGSTGMPGPIVVVTVAFLR